MPSVLVLDDHDLIRRGIVATIESASDFEVVAEAANARQALSRADATHPDLAVLDMRLPDGDGAAVCRSVRQISPVTRCVVICSVDDDAARAAAADAGAAAFLLKSVTARVLIESLRAVAAGRVLHDTLRAAPARSATRPSTVRLTPRERQLMDLLEQGRSNREIGSELGLAEKTVKNYLTALMRKLELQSRTQVAVLSAQRRVS